MVRPVPWIARFRRQLLCSGWRRVRIQYRDIPSSVRLNLRDVDRVHEHQQIALPFRVKEDRYGADSHQDDAVLRDQTFRELRKTVRHPGIDSHVGEDARAVDEPGLGGDEKKRSLGDHRHHDEVRADRESAQPPGSEETLSKDHVRVFPSTERAWIRR
jgi:hypothetical protein